MSEENVEIVRRLFEAFQDVFQRDDPATAGTLFDSELVAEDAEWIPFRGWPGPQSYRGRDGFVEFWSTWTEDFEGWSVELERLVDGGDEQVVALFHQTATGRGSGTPVKLRFRPGLRAGRWSGDSDAELHGPGRSPRSRRAVGVGDVAGEAHRGERGLLPGPQQEQERLAQERCFGGRFFDVSAGVDCAEHTICPGRNGRRSARVRSDCCAPGHTADDVDPGVEEVVKGYERFSIVEKRREAGEIAH